MIQTSIRRYLILVSNGCITCSVHLLQYFVRATFIHQAYLLQTWQAGQGPSMVFSLSLLWLRPINKIAVGTAASLELFSRPWCFPSASSLSQLEWWSHTSVALKKSGYLFFFFFLFWCISTNFINIVKNCIPLNATVLDEKSSAGFLGMRMT